jgi:NADH dehydrogenase
VHQAGKRHIVILGGGFAGFYAALRFERALKHRSDIEVTIVDKENFFLFTPMLAEVAAGDLSPQAIVYPLRKSLRRVNFFKATIDFVDLKDQVVHLIYGESNEHRTQLHYDHLILSLGSVTNFFKIEGLEERALTIKSLGDAIHLRDHLIATLEAADIENYSHERKRRLTFVVAGGGFAGVETMAAVNDFIRESVRYYPHLNNELVRMVLAHAGEAILPEFDRELGDYAQRKLEERQVEVLTRTHVVSFANGLVQLSNGAPIECNTLIWAAGVVPSLAIEKLNLKKERGHVVVDQYMRSPDHENVWAAGDCAFIPNSKTGKPYPPTAQHALREGHRLANNILAHIDGKPLTPFTYSMLGQMAVIGRRTGVAMILGIKISGFFGWFLWRTIYLAKLPGLDRKCRVGFQWLLDIFFPPDLSQYSSLREHAANASLPARPNHFGGTTPFQEDDAPEQRGAIIHK